MKKYGILLTLVILSAVFCVSAEAVTDKTASVSATVNITPITWLSAAPSTIAFGTYSADAFPTDPTNSKIVLTYDSNYSPWKIAIYTNNTVVKNQADGGKYVKGGLATTSGSNVIPCKWVSKIGTNAVVPTVPSFTSLYNFIKDKRDEDDPSTVGQDESWTTAFAAGYPNIAFGTGPGAQGYCVDPTNTAPGVNQYKGDAVNGSIAVYVAGLFGTGGATSAGDYSSSIYFDLYHE